MAERVIGQNHIYEHFENAIKAGKISHAYILNGEKGTGKLEIAKQVAKALQCEKNRGEKNSGVACGECQSCKQTESKNQPDIKYVTPDKKTLGVDDIRYKINEDASIKPYSSPYKIYIIPASDKMTVQAQNALLKTIEEPPKYAVFFLLASNIDMFLPTILSRCVVLNMRTVSEDEIAEQLRKEFEVGDYDAMVAAAFAGGNIGKARDLIASENFQETKQSVSEIIREVANGGMDVISKKIKDLGVYKEDKEGLKDYLDMLRLWFKDVLKYKSTEDERDIVFQDSMNDIKQLSSQVSFDNLNEILEIINQAENRIKSNVGFDSNLEVMLLGIKERLQ